MPVDWSKYPKDWKQRAIAVKNAANWVCQGCDRPCKKPDETWDEFKYRLAKKSKRMYLEACEKKTRFVLTVAHLNHKPMDCREENLKALCSVCHLRYDAKHHAKTRKKKTKRGENGGRKINRISSKNTKIN